MGMAQNDTTRLYYDFMVFDIAIALTGGMHSRWRLALERRYYSQVNVATTTVSLTGISQLLDLLIEHCGYSTIPNETVSKELACAFRFFTLSDTIHLLSSDNVHSRYSGCITYSKAP